MYDIRNMVSHTNDAFFMVIIGVFKSAYLPFTDITPPGRSEKSITGHIASVPMP